MCAFFSPHQQTLQLFRYQLGALQFNSETIYPELTQIPQVKGPVPQDCPSFQMLMTRLSLRHFRLTSYKLGFTVVPSSVLDNLVEGLTELTYVLCLRLPVY